MNDFAGRVVLITGATGSAGPAVAHALAAEGAILVLSGRDQARLDKVANELGMPCTTVVADLATAESAQELVNTVLTRCERLDGVIHLIGGWRSGGIKGFTRKDLDWLNSQLVVTTAEIVAAAREPLLQSGGVFVNVSSPVTSNITPGNVAYAAAKAAADDWVLALSKSFGGSKARTITYEVSALCTEAMRQINPEKDFSKYTDVEELAATVISSWFTAANGSRITLTK